MATVPPTIEERLARLKGVYDHLSSLIADDQLDVGQ